MDSKPYLNHKKKKVLVSGIQPSGELHLGNYFGAIKQMVDLINSNQFESYIFVADYHSMTTLINPKERTENVLEIVAIYLACGMNPKKVNIFKQSAIPEVTELNWILNTVTPIPMLFLAHAFKDKTNSQNNTKVINLENLKDVNVGLFDYPILMASDILIYGGEIVPVGQDQIQHVEYARELAKKYNYIYKTSIFKAPKEYVKEKVAIVPGIDGKKMAKSKNNQIPIFTDITIIKKRINSIVTDNKLPNEKKFPDESNLYKIHRLFLSEIEDEKLRERFLNSDKIPYSYKEAKENLYTTFIEYFKDMQQKYNYYMTTEKGKKELQRIISKGAKKARLIAKNKLKIVRKEVGLD